MKINKTDLKKKKVSFLRTFELSNSVKDSCDKSGISRATYYRWLQDDPDFKKHIDERIESEMSLAKQVLQSSTVDVIEELKLICLGKPARLAQVNAINTWLDRVGIVPTKEPQEENSFMTFINAVRCDYDGDIENDSNPTEGLGIYSPPS